MLETVKGNVSKGLTNLNVNQPPPPKRKKICATTNMKNMIPEMSFLTIFEVDLIFNWTKKKVLCLSLDVHTTSLSIWFF